MCSAKSSCYMFRTKDAVMLYDSTPATKARNIPDLSHIQFDTDSVTVL